MAPGAPVEDSSGSEVPVINPSGSAPTATEQHSESPAINVTSDNSPDAPESSAQAQPANTSRVQWSEQPPTTHSVPSDGTDLDPDTLAQLKVYVLRPFFSIFFFA